MASNNRIVFIDYIRVIACFLVMLVHASENFYGSDASGLASSYSFLASESNRFWVAFYDGFVARTCVPLFMIVSAFLLVPSKTGMTEFYRRRFGRIMPPMICFLLLYTFLPLLWGQMSLEQSLSDLKMLPFTFPSMAGHMWFMYPLISIYLIIPVVSPWLEKASAKEERIFIALFVASTFIPWLTRLLGGDIFGFAFWNPYFHMLYYCSGYLGYLVIAHYIRVHMQWSRRKRMTVGALCFLAGAAFTGWSFWHVAVPGTLIETTTVEWSWEFCTPNVLCATFGAFLMFTCIERKEAPSWITGISKLSFGMYLMHMFFLSNIAPVFVTDDAANPIVPVYLAIPCIAVLTYVCCVITAKLISLLPGSKWIIG